MDKSRIVSGSANILFDSDSDESGEKKLKELLDNKKKKSKKNVFGDVKYDNDIKLRRSIIARAIKNDVYYSTPMPTKEGRKSLLSPDLSLNFSPINTIDSPSRKTTSKDTNSEGTESIRSKNKNIINTDDNHVLRKKNLGGNKSRDKLKEALTSILIEEQNQSILVQSNINLEDKGVKIHEEISLNGCNKCQHTKLSKQNPYEEDNFTKECTSQNISNKIKSTKNVSNNSNKITKHMVTPKANVTCNVSISSSYKRKSAENDKSHGDSKGRRNIFSNDSKIRSSGSSSRGKDVDTKKKCFAAKRISFISEASDDNLAENVIDNHNRLPTVENPKTKEKSSFSISNVLIEEINNRRALLENREDINSSKRKSDTDVQKKTIVSGAKSSARRKKNQKPLKKKPNISCSNTSSQEAINGDSLARENTIPSFQKIGGRRKEEDHSCLQKNTSLARHADPNREKTATYNVSTGTRRRIIEKNVQDKGTSPLKYDAKENITARLKSKNSAHAKKNLENRKTFMDVGTSPFVPINSLTMREEEYCEKKEKRLSACIDKLAYLKENPRHCSRTHIVSQSRNNCPRIKWRNSCRAFPDYVYVEHDKLVLREKFLQLDINAPKYDSDCESVATERSLLIRQAEKMANFYDDKSFDNDPVMELISRTIKNIGELDCSEGSSDEHEIQKSNKIFVSENVQLVPPSMPHAGVVKKLTSEVHDNVSGNSRRVSEQDQYNVSCENRQKEKRVEETAALTMKDGINCIQPLMVDLSKNNILLNRPSPSRNSIGKVKGLKVNKKTVKSTEAVENKENYNNVDTHPDRPSKKQPKLRKAKSSLVMKKKDIVSSTSMTNEETGLRRSGRERRPPISKVNSYEIIAVQSLSQMKKLGLKEFSGNLLDHIKDYTITSLTELSKAPKRNYTKRATKVDSNSKQEKEMKTKKQPAKKKITKNAKNHVPNDPPLPALLEETSSSTGNDYEISEIQDATRKTTKKVTVAPKRNTKHKTLDPVDHPEETERMGASRSSDTSCATSKTAGKEKTPKLKENEPKISMDKESHGVLPNKRKKQDEQDINSEGPGSSTTREKESTCGLDEKVPVSQEKRNTGPAMESGLSPKTHNNTNLNTIPPNVNSLESCITVTPGKSNRNDTDENVFSKKDCTRYHREIPSRRKVLGELPLNHQHIDQEFHSESQDSGRSTMRITTHETAGSTNSNESCLKTSRPLTGRITKKTGEIRQSTRMKRKIAKQLSSNPGISMEIVVPNSNDASTSRADTEIPHDTSQIDAAMENLTQAEQNISSHNGDVDILRLVSTKQEFRPIQQNLWLSNFLKFDDRNSAAILKIPPRCEKAAHVAKKYTMCYTVFSGEALVRIQDKSCKVGVLNRFAVPVGTEYAIKNLSEDETLTLSFTKIRKELCSVGPRIS